MMKRILTLALGAAFALSAAVGCSGGGEGAKVFSKTVSKQFGGIGVEWDAYEHPLEITEDRWETVLERIGRIKPALVRCMINYSWFTKNFDSKATEAVTDDTWEYYWTNPTMESAYKILDYCQENGIKVALGAWRAMDEWQGSEALLTSDPRYAKVTGELFDQLIVKRGYDCVKWIVPSNEPNYLPGNTFDLWAQGVKNVAAELAARGLSDKVSLLGPDATSFAAAQEWGGLAAKQVKDYLSNYAVHLYVNDYVIDSGKMRERTSEILDAIRRNDSDQSKRLYIWEAGLLDGTSDIGNQELIDTFDYGLRMADYTFQALQGGADGIVYWELDEAMHYLANGELKQFGMFSSVGTPQQRELRPWYHSSAAISRIFRAGAVLKEAENIPDKVRALAAVCADGTGGYGVVNRGSAEVSLTLRAEGLTFTGKQYVYVFHPSEMKLGADGYLIPNGEFEGRLCDNTLLRIPAGSAVFVTNEKL